MIVIKVLVALVCLAMFSLGTMSMFAPNKMVKNFSIEPVGAAGLNTIRGVIGGFFIASLAMLVIGLVTVETLWFLAVAILLGVVVIGRLVGLALDGFEKSVIPPIVLEIVMVAILVAAHLQLGAA